MWTLINMVDCTDFIAPDSEDNGSAQSGGISFSASLSDPATTCDFVVDDINQTINVQNIQPVIVWDENAPAIGGVSTVPSMNFARNVLLATSGLWTISGTLSGLVTFTGGGPNVTMTFNNNAVGSGIASQQTLLGYVQPGVQYMWSMYLTGSGVVNNIQGLLQVTFQDIFGVTLGSTITATYTPGAINRKNITGVAPANAAFAFISFGGQTTNATNSGTITWGTPQFEPMWFTSKGIKYPTPDCNAAQVSSVLMPDGTTSRACRLFAGYVEDTKNAYVGKQRHTTVQCASSSKLLETAGVISASYTNTVDTTILSNALGLLPTNASIIGRLATGQQHFFGPSSTLIAGVTVDSISFNNATIREVCNGLAAQSGSIYYVDPYYYLWYVPPSFAGATVMLSDNPDNINSFPYHDFRVEYDSTNPINVALVVGSKQNAAAITDTFSGDGSTTLFNLSFPPHTVTSVTKNSGAAVRCGVAGVDQITATIRALINKQNQTITFAVAPVAGANNTLVTYTYEDQVISQVIAADAVASQKMQFWGLVSDSNITSTTAAKNRGLKELTDYANPRTILTLSSLGIYMPVGSLILFTCASEGMTNTPFVVQTVSSDLQGGGVYRWNYTAGVYNPTLIDHIRNVHKAVKKSPTTANVAVIASTDVALFDSFVINDSLVANPSTYASAVGVDLPLCQYRVGESAGTTANDISGNGNNGTLHGGITLGTTGLINHDTNKAMTFNGTTGYISLPTTGLATGANAWSMEAWVRMPNPLPTSGGGFNAVMAFGTPGVSNEVAIIYYRTTVQSFRVDVVSTTIQSSVVTAGGIYHVVATYDGTTLKLYLNGVLQGSAAVALNIVASIAQIGNDNSGDFWAGPIDEVAIYNTVLSGTRVLAHYNAGI